MMTDKEVEEIRARCDKATEGPWKTHLVDDTSIVTEDGTDVCTTCDSSQAEREDGYNVEYERMEADADFIAHARTDIPALLAEVTRLTAVEAELRAELAKYHDADIRSVDEARRVYAIVDALAQSNT